MITNFIRGVNNYNSTDNLNVTPAPQPGIDGSSTFSVVTSQSVATDTAPIVQTSPADITVSTTPNKSFSRFVVNGYLIVFTTLIAMF